MGVKILYDVRIPAISIQVEAASIDDAIKQARSIVKKVVADHLMKAENYKIKSIKRDKMVDVHDVEQWPWIECPKCRFGQRADPKLLGQGAKPYCPDCKIEMKVRPKPTN